MQFHSTRNPNVTVSFAHAVLDCMASDGGLYVPAYEENLRPWILYMNSGTTFASLAGALTSALIKEEFSPIISEAIATRAFPFSPEIRQLDDSLYALELFHGPTGSHKDFGVSYLASCLEHILLMQNRRAIVFAISDGGIAPSVVYALRNAKHLKAVILFPEGQSYGFTAEDCIWNGGNIYPVEVAGTTSDCHAITKELFAHRDIIEKYNITLANTANIGRLLPQAFFYTFAFSRLKEQVYGDIYYALAAGNYSNLVAGLYSWKFSLPVNGFITDSTPALGVDASGKCQMLDSFVPVEKRYAADPGSPSNLERLEEVFLTMPAVMRGLVYPSKITDKDRESACKNLFMKYGLFADPATSGAYASAIKRAEMIRADDGAVVLVMRDHPAFEAERIRQWCGEAPSMPEVISAMHMYHPACKQILTGGLPELEQVLAEVSRE